MNIEKQVVIQVCVFQGLSNDIELQKQNAIKRDKAIQGLSHEVGKKVNEVSLSDKKWLLDVTYPFWAIFVLCSYF